MKSFWTELDVTKPGPLSTSKIELFVIIVNSWKLLTSILSSLDPPWPNYDFQRTEEGCSNVNSVVVYVDDVDVDETPFRFYSKSEM